MNRFPGIITSCLLLLLLGCSDNCSMKVVFDGFGDPPLRCVAKVGKDGTFKCKARGAELWNWAGVLYRSLHPKARGYSAVTCWLKGAVTPATGGAYIVTFCIEERAYTSLRRYFPYEAYLETIRVLPNTEFIVTPGDTVTLRVDGVSNQQGGVNGKQPFGSETNRTSAAAAPRRSP